MEGILTGLLKMLTRVFSFFLTLFWVFALSAQDPAPATPDLSNFDQDAGIPAEWGPHIVDHLYKGCPTNSLCSQSSGDILEDFKKLLSKRPSLSQIENFKNKKGIPFEVWSSKPDLELNKLHAVHWESQCPAHQIDGQKIYQSFLMVHNLDQLKLLVDDQTLFIRYGLSLDAKKNIIKIPGPKGESPLYLENGDPVFVQEFEGGFYSIRISTAGNITVINEVKPEEMPENIRCSKDLVAAFKSEKRPPHLYTNVYCQKIYDIKTKKKVEMLFARGCP